MNQDTEKRIAKQVPRILKAMAHNKGAHGCPICGSLGDCHGWAYLNEIDSIARNPTGRISDLRKKGYDVECYEKKDGNSLYHNLGRKVMQIEGRMVREVRLGVAPVEGGIEFSELVSV